MECNQNLITAQLDGELDPSAVAVLAEHLQSCSACQQYLRSAQALRATLADPALRHTAPSHLRFRIQTDLDALKTQARKLETAAESTRRARPNWLSLGLAGSGSLALAFSLMLYLSVPSGTAIVNQQIVASHYRSLLANHMADVASSDHHTVKPWFTGKLDYAPVVQDFAGQGFPLIGGRLDYIDQRTVAALAYRHGNHLINVFMWPDQSNRGKSMSTIQGYHLLRWSSQGMAFSAVSDMSEDELQHLRELIQGAGGPN
jgi:anti-sigma factor RsiW